MKLFMNRLIVVIKRCALSPFMYVMASVLIILSMLAILIPESEKSVYLPVAILNKDDNEKTEEIVDSLCEMRSIFHFYHLLRRLDYKYFLFTPLIKINKLR